MGASHTGDTEGVGVEDSENPLLRVVEGVGVGVWVADSVAVVLGVGELEKLYPVDMEGVGDRVGVAGAVGVLEAVGGAPRIATLSTVSAPEAEPTATAVRRQHKLLAAKPSAATGSMGVACAENVVPRGVSAITAPTLVKAPAEPVVE